MSNVMIGVDTPVPASISGRKPAKLWRRADRTHIKKLLQAIKVIRNMDGREELRSITQGFTPKLFRQSNGTTIDRALNNLAQACSTALTATV